MSSKRGKNKKVSGVKMYSSAFVAGSSATTKTTAQNLSSDHRRVVQKTSRTRAPSPIKQQRRNEPPPQPQDEGVNSEIPSPEQLDDIRRVTSSQKRRMRKRKGCILASDEPMRQFRSHIDEYVHSIMRAEGRDDAREAPCPGCEEGFSRPAEYRCKECFGGALFCRECLVKEHARRPFCRIQHWTGKSFTKCSLQNLGHRLRLGHPEHEQCPCPITKTDAVVIHVNGLHKVTVEFCGCAKSCGAGGEQREQLLRRRLFPATTTDPHTFCTFDVLRLFHVVTLQGKVTAYDFYAALEKLTDMFEVEGWKDRYRSFLRCARQWRFLKQLKLSGRGNDTTKAPSEFSAGELAVTCPACPHPGVNLPDDWKLVPKEDKFLYNLFIALDACFRLKRRKVSSWAKDPSLVNGGAYMVESAAFEQFIHSVGSQAEINTCTGLSALDHANTKYHKGYAETGKMLGLCARHEFLQRDGIVATQVGERYANTDYALASLLRHHSPDLHIVLSYDICCQYSRQLAERLRAYDFPDGFRVNVDANTIRFVIPKLHIHGHKLLCQLFFNFNWTCGCGRTDGEGVERPWAALGLLGTSLRVMGPGSASDTLDDHGNFWNACREVGLGVLTRRRLVDAFAELAVQTAELQDFRAGHAEHIAEWEAAVIAFEEDKESVPNPFEPPAIGASEREVALELATEEEMRARDGLDSRHELSPCDFLLALLDIENRQRTLKLEVAAKNFTTTPQLTELARRRAKLSHAIGRLRSVQAVYTPASLKHVESRAEGASSHAEDEPLFPPSALPASDRATCLDIVIDAETRLRVGQCRTALQGIRDLLLNKSRMLTYKNHNVRHQGATTRARALLAKNDEKINALVQKYIDARRALICLAEGDESQVLWPALDPGTDIRCMDDPDSSRTRGVKRARPGDTADEPSEANGGGGHLQHCRDATGEGRRTVSWIWKNVGVEGGEGALYQGVKIEYCKAFSRVRRWKEEVRLLQEEMRRILQTLEWKARAWERREGADTRDDPVGEGARAYARKRADLYRSLASKFDNLWAGLRGRTTITPAEAHELRMALEREDADAAHDASSANGGGEGEDGEDEDGEDGEDEDGEDDEVGEGEDNEGELDGDDDFDGGYSGGGGGGDLLEQGVSGGMYFDNEGI